MYNYAATFNAKFRNYKVLGGTTSSEVDSHKTIFAGPDPADPSRILIRKLVRVSESTYCFEECRITPKENGQPTVHTQLFRLKDVDLKEKLTPYEIQTRGGYRPIPNVMGFSLYFK